jgi:hypothetical protein
MPSILIPSLAVSNQREGFRRYVEGLLLPTERHKTLTGLTNTEPIVGAQLPRVQKLQWVRIASRTGMSARSRPNGSRSCARMRLRLPMQVECWSSMKLGIVRMVDIPAHVGRQYLGNLGKIDNGVVSVTSLWADEQVYYPLEIEPYTPESYFAKGRNDPGFRTKLKIALHLVQQAIQQRWPFRAMVADSFYGEDRGLRSGLQKLSVPYVMALKPSHAGRASRGCGRPPERRGTRGGVGEYQTPRQVGSDHQNLP